MALDLDLDGKVAVVTGAGGNLGRAVAGGVFLGMRACLPVMRERGGGAIVAMSSIEGLGGSPGLYAYNTSKAAILNLVRAVAMDYAASGVRVNAVCPGMVAPASPEASSPAAREVHRVVTANIPMGRPARADEVGDAVVFLSSARASYITGEALCVDGGVGARTGSFPPRAAGAPAGFDGASMRASAGTRAQED